jgi:hypothetical protein
MIPFDDTGATLTTDELAASQAGYPARPDAEKRAWPAFFVAGTRRCGHSRLSLPTICC